jgi:hypothetical protein
MLKRVYFFILIILLLPCILFSETHVGGVLEGEIVWDVEGSPYIVDELIEFGENGADLIIEAGVTVQFTDFTGIYSEYGGSITAEGTIEDSIYFIPIPLDDRWSGIKIENIPASGSFDYCFFYRSFGHHESDPTLSGFRSSFELKHTTIRDASCLIRNSNLSSVIEDCFFTGLILNGIMPYVRDDSITVRRCVFAANPGYGYGVIGTYKGIIDQCIFYNTRCAAGTRNTPGGTITNSVFYCDGYTEGAAVSSYPLIVSNNCVYNRADITSHEMEGVGIIDRVNANGDSTDRFGNMLLDPQLAGLIDSVYIYPDSYYLTESSPCIDAGDPESDPDPDGTCTDIGAFFYPQQNIAVKPDTLELIDIQTGISDSVSCIIYNVGLDTLHVESQSISYESSTDDFFRIGQGGEEFFLEPDSNQTVWIIFSPFEQAVYEALLTIESNDRDQGILEIPIVASALSVSGDPNILHEFALYEAYPNPFNSTTTITYGLAKPAPARLALYDISGRKVMTLFKGYKQAGNHTATLKANDLPSGLYFVRLEAEGFNQSRKLVLVR